MSSVLVTGGAGFIGSLLVERLVREGHSVTVLDNFSHCREGQLDAVKDKVSLVKLDLSEEADVIQLCKGKDYIFHLAAQKSVDKSIESPTFSARENVLGLVNILQGAKVFKVKRVIAASTAAVYGYNDSFPLKETEVPDPQSPYALEKVVGEQYMALFYKLYGVDSASLRFFNVYGPRQYSSAPHCGGVTIVMDELEKNRVSSVLGDGTQTRDMIFVGDVVESMVQAMNAVGPLKGDVYNISTGTRISVLELNAAIAAAMGLKAGDYSHKHLHFAEGNVVHSQGDPTKASQVFGWEAKTSLEEGLRQTWEWKKEHPNFYS